MSLFRLLQNPNWIRGRRIAMVLLIIVLGLRTYGNSISSWLSRASPERDVVITRYEFRPELANAKPAWIITFQNASSKHIYDFIELEATYMDQSGKVLETDKLLVRQRLLPGEEQMVASTDIKNRPGATTGTLRVTGAETMKK
jgi:hypothetical protein